ncbi:hypothetical protein L1987_87438 [Smallanthus sonchifolius]|nr:hypothetical protein L1987_87438 [Smallanthus sonchifolius]
MDRKMRTERSSYRDVPYRRDSHRGYSQSDLCKNCKRPGHYARDCPNVAICHNCGLPGHIASEKTGHIARDCINDPVCNSCHVAGHVSRDCPKGSMMVDDRGGPQATWHLNALLGGSRIAFQGGIDGDMAACFTLLFSLKSDDRFMFC